MAADVKIDIAAEFTGKKAFKEAETSADKLNNSVKDLAKGLISVYSAQKVLSYAKASVKAFTEDDKAARTLTKTLNNLGLQFADPAVRTFISDLERQYAVLDDLLRPAYQKLVTGTGDWRKSQELLKTALDLSAQSGVDVVTVAEDLANAYIGNTRGLRKYTLGLSVAQLSGMKFEAILEKIATVSEGQASAAADTYAGKMDKLSIVVNNLSEAIGESLVDSFANLAGNGDLDKSISKLEKFTQTGIGLFRLLTGADSLSAAINSLDYRFGIIPTERTPNTNRSKSPAGTAQRLAAEKKAEQEALKRARDAAKAAKDKAAAERKTLQAKRLGLLVDKASLALNKGESVFDMDKIQIAAALTNQAQQLGKATSSAQVMQIANDTARLNVKLSMLELEDAIAAKDEAAIIAATKKLNEDLKVLGALTGQKVTLESIESILKGLKPKDLIDLSNLDAALAKIAEMLGLLAKANAQAKAAIPNSASLGSGIPAGDYIAPISTKGGSIGAILEYAEAAAGRANAFADLLDMQNASAATSMGSVIDLESIARSSLLQGLSGGAGVSGAVSGSRYAAQAAQYYITNNFGVVGDPNSAAEMINNLIVEARDRGTLTIA